MAAKSRNIMIKIDGVRLLGVRSKTITIANEFVDVTNESDEVDGNLWRMGLGGAGDRMVSVTGAGVFKDGAAIRQFQDISASGEHSSMALEFENGDTITGNFLITSLEYIGEHFDVQQYAISLESVVDGSVSLNRA